MNISQEICPPTPSEHFNRVSRPTCAASVSAPLSREPLQSVRTVSVEAVTLWASWFVDFLFYVVVLFSCVFYVLLTCVPSLLPTPVSHPPLPASLHLQLRPSLVQFVFSLCRSLVLTSLLSSCLHPVSSGSSWAPRVLHLFDLSFVLVVFYCWNYLDYLYRQLFSHLPFWMFGSPGRFSSFIKASLFVVNLPVSAFQLLFSWIWRVAIQHSRKKSCSQNVTWITLSQQMISSVCNEHLMQLQVGPDQETSRDRRRRTHEETWQMIEL